MRLAAALGSALAGLVLVGAFHPGLGGATMRSLFLLPETVRGMLTSCREPMKLRSGSAWLAMSVASHPSTECMRYHGSLCIASMGCGL